ncbi:hypothetical protein [Prosthecobacter sp.]|uniref:hypothetical protein n=1 Tax=Prosthecobacter sp. TaxID=1965333 RepID=UPI0037849700
MKNAFQRILTLCALLLFQSCETARVFKMEAAGASPGTKEAPHVISPELQYRSPPGEEPYVPSPDIRKRFGAAMMEFESKYGFIIDPKTNAGRHPPLDRAAAALTLVLPRKGRSVELSHLRGSGHNIRLVRTPQLCYALLSDLSTSAERPFFRHLANDLDVIVARHLPEVKMKILSYRWVYLNLLN